MARQRETIAIIDYGMGNIRNVENAFLKINSQRQEQIEIASRVLITREAKAILKADKIILPGVGAFGECMYNLKRYGLIEPIRKAIEAGKLFLGICLGLQLLFEGSEESPGVAGLSVFKGKVRKIDAPTLKIPQIGWNSLMFKKKSRLFHNIDEGCYVYFVHSFHPAPENESIISAVADYGEVITAAVHDKNVRAVQFHPEKSGDVGLKILANFLGE